MLLKILVVAGLLIVAFVVVVARRPSIFRVERSATLAAAPAVVFAHVNTARAWEAWSPFIKVDPHATWRYEGPAAGVGAVTAWSGNRRAGAGRTTIIESRAPERIRLRLEMERPFAATNLVEFTFRPSGSGTQVTWSMSGPCNFLAKAVGLFIDCDKMVGAEFEQGLAALDRATRTAVAEPVPGA